MTTDPAKRKRRFILVMMALAMPLLVFGLPVLAVLWLGPQRGDALAQWANRQAVARHQHPAGQEVPSFALLDQREKTLTREDLKGRVWVASFFLSRCAGTCPM